MRRHLALGSLTATLMLFAAGSASAVTKYSNLDCCIAAGTSPSWATATAGTETAIGSGTETQTQGFNVAYSADTDYEIQCSWIVPLDYNNSGSTAPQVVVAGWSTVTKQCTSNCSGANRYINFLVASRRYVDGSMANASWSSDSTLILSWTVTQVLSLWYW